MAVVEDGFDISVHRRNLDVDQIGLAQPTAIRHCTKFMPCNLQEELGAIE